MWTLRKRFTFEASHVLPLHGGKCARLHGHSWKGELVVGGDFLRVSGPSSGMLIDYGEMSAVVRPLLENYLDHRHLNTSLELNNPTSEEVARWIYNRVKPLLPQLNAVRVEETCTSSCEYRP